MKDKTHKKFLIAGICFFLISLGLFAYTFMQSGIDNDNKVQEGYLPGMSEEELQEEMDKRVDENMLAISINSNLIFEDGKSEGDIRIANTKSNHYRMVVEIKRNDNQQVIYKTGFIEPGFYIEKDKLDVNLKKGTYPVTITFTAYQKDSETEVGKSIVTGSVMIKK